MRNWTQPASVSVLVMITSNCFSLFVLTMNIFLWKIEILWAYRKSYCIKHISILWDLYTIFIVRGTDVLAGNFCEIGLSRRKTYVLQKTWPGFLISCKIKANQFSRNFKEGFSRTFCCLYFLETSLTHAFKQLLNCMMYNFQGGFSKMMIVEKWESGFPDVIKNYVYWTTVLRNELK